jgi:hypothetical protein
MIDHVSRRAIAVAAGALLSVAIACQDSSTAPAGGDQIGLAATASQPGDTTHGTPPGDPPANPPVTAFNLTVSVSAPVSGGDTTQFTPLANAKVTVYSFKLVSGSGGGDTTGVSKTVVVTGTTNGAGQITFASLPSAQYLVEAIPAGASSGPSLHIGPPYAAHVDLNLIVRP